MFHSYSCLSYFQTIINNESERDCEIFHFSHKDLRVDILSCYDGLHFKVRGVVCLCVKCVDPIKNAFPWDRSCCDNKENFLNFIYLRIYIQGLRERDEMRRKNENERNVGRRNMNLLHSTLPVKFCTLFLLSRHENCNLTTLSCTGLRLLACYFN